MDHHVLNSTFSPHFLLRWFQGPDWEPTEFSACCRFRWSHPSQTQRERGIIWRLQPWSFSPYEVIHTHTLPIISPTRFPFNISNSPNAGSVDSKLITASTLVFVFLMRHFYKVLFEFQNERGWWWAVMSTLLKNFIQNRSPARNLRQNQLLHCKCLHNTDHVRFTMHNVKCYRKKIINTLLELSCEYLILCPKPKIQLQELV